MDFCFQQGREFAQSHPSNWRSAKVFQIHVGMELSEQREQVLVSHMDGKEINAIPHDVVRDKQGNIVGLRDTGGIIRIASTYLPAFYVGMRTAHLSETQAEHALEDDKAKQARFLTDEIKNAWNREVRTHE